MKKHHSFTLGDIVQTRAGALAVVIDMADSMVDFADCIEFQEITPRGKRRVAYRDFNGDSLLVNFETNHVGSYHLQKYESADDMINDTYDGSIFDIAKTFRNKVKFQIIVE